MNKIIEYIKLNRRETIIIATITLFALALRLMALQNYGDLWLDELYSWYFASQDNVLKTITSLLDEDIHMPAFFVILHFWMKLFGQSDISMHLCSLFLALPVVPVSFYLMKNLFNAKTGYFACLMFTINTFFIYYSLEVRFYGFVILLALITAATFSEMLKNFDKKYIVAFIISNLLLIYTYSITGILTLIYAITCAIYLIVAKRKEIKKSAYIFLLLLIFSIPAIIIIINNFIAMQHTICSFTKDIYTFDWKIITEAFVNYFSNHNVQILTGNINHYDNLINNLLVPKFLFIAGIPIVIGLIGLIKSLLTKNIRLILFLMPSIIFFIISLILGSTGTFSMLLKYTAIIYPVIICATCYGLSELKIKHTSVILFLLFLILNYLYILIIPQNIFLLQRKELGTLTDVLEQQVHINDSDLLLIPYAGSKIMRYVPKGKFINFEADDAVLLKDINSKYIFLGSDASIINTENDLRTYLKLQANNNEVTYAYKTFIANIVQQMQPNERLILITHRDMMTNPVIEHWEILKDKNIQSKISLFTWFMAKVIKDSLIICNQELTPITTLTNNNQGYTIYIFKKKNTKY